MTFPKSEIFDLDKPAQTIELVEMLVDTRIEIEALKDLLEKHGIITSLEFDACKSYLSSTGQRKEVLDYIARTKAGISHYKSNQQDYLRDLFNAKLNGNL